MYASALSAPPPSPPPVAPLGPLTSDFPAALDASDLLGPELSSALAAKGYTTLTPVQRSVLDPELAGRDLRISSQTGSGKTLALGFALRSELDDLRSKAPGDRDRLCQPRAIVVAPTRELARQLETELSWLYAPLGLRVAAVTGGSNYRDEHRALARGPAVVVGTPGRLVDHLERGGIDPARVGAVVLDEADHMLDLGFREELDAILEKLPEEHRTHLVSATFSREVKALADRVQHAPLNVEGTPLGAANADIHHVVHIVHAEERMAALVNLLLMHPDDRVLVFARTRVDVASITAELQRAGFAADSLSGDMEQIARNRALSAFRSGRTRALVATDVAARGIDVPDVSLVIQFDPPSDSDGYTHRSGRTGRAGRKGTSAMLVTPGGVRRTTGLLAHARVTFRIEPIPTADAIRAAQDERLFAELTGEVEGAEGEGAPASRFAGLARKLVQTGCAERALVQLLTKLPRVGIEPRSVTPLNVDPARRRAPTDHRASADNGPTDRRFPRGDGPPASGERPLGWATFRVSWGGEHGADPRRLLAMLCRRGGIQGTDIGTIRVQRGYSTVDIAARVADAFREAVREPDPRDPRVVIAPYRAPAPAPASRFARPRGAAPRKPMRSH